MLWKRWFWLALLTFSLISVPLALSVGRFSVAVFWAVILAVAGTVVTFDKSLT